MTLFNSLFLQQRERLGRSVAATLVLIMTGSVSIVSAEPTGTGDANYKNRPLDVRVDRLERLMGSQKQLELLYRMNQLQKENQQLRSSLEEQNNEIQQLKQQIRELYGDVNRRLNQMEGVDATTPAVAPQSGTQPPDTTELPEVVDKSSIKPSQYGVTKREVIQVKDDRQGQAQAAEKPPVATIKPMSEKQRKAEQKAYQQAYNELTARQYVKARESFIVFIQKYPSGRYAHIAQYWIAESSYALRNFEQAIKDYQLLLDVYPFSPKKAEAELKKAYSYYELGDKQNARQMVNQLLLNYPGTTEAGQAKRLLKKL